MTLTEQWKKGELESGYYYIVVKQVEFPNRIDFYNSSATVWSYHSNDCVKEVLAPVPSYEEWQQLHKFLEEFNALDVAKENQHLKELLKECKEHLCHHYCQITVGKLEKKIEEVLK